VTTSFEQIGAGDELPELVLDVTARLIVAGALASRDFQNVHHDKAAAIKSGSPDIFMNILTDNGLIGRYVTDWAGPDARLTGISIRLGVPNRPGDQLRFGGSVESIDPAARAATISVRGTNSLGDHVIGTAKVQWS
jgi:acyl dehydratase